MSRWDADLDWDDLHQLFDGSTLGAPVVESATIRERLNRLLDELHAADVDVRHWPWSMADVDGLERHAEHRAKAIRLGGTWWIADLENERAKTHAEEESRRRSGPRREWEVDEVLAVKRELEEQGRPSGYKSIARELPASPSTVRRRLQEARDRGLTA